MQRGLGTSSLNQASIVAVQRTAQGYHAFAIQLGVSVTAGEREPWWCSYLPSAAARRERRHVDGRRRTTTTRGSRSSRQVARWREKRAGGPCRAGPCHAVPCRAALSPTYDGDEKPIENLARLRSSVDTPHAPVPPHWAWPQCILYNRQWVVSRSAGYTWRIVSGSDSAIPRFRFRFRFPSPQLHNPIGLGPTDQLGRLPEVQLLRRKSPPTTIVSS